MDGMSPEEFDDYIDSVSMRDRNNALEGMSGMKRLRVGISHEDQTVPIGDQFNDNMRRGVLRLVWLAGWAWMFFTFGWVGYFIVRFTEKELKKS